jgi:dTDP-4-dehydrorhamnose reductase
MKARRAVVLGAGGLLGGYLVRELERHEVSVTGFDRAACPLEDEARVREAVAGANWVFNPAAFTDVDGAERRPEAAWAANALGAENVARAAREAGAPGAVVVHVSTDFVFDGALSRPYDEFDEPRPQSTYARTKRAGELLVMAAAPRHHVVRVQGLYGAGGRNFASKLQGLLREGKTGLRLDDERRVQPTFARAAARALVTIAGSDRYGLWHASCRGETTWHRFTLRLAERLGIAPSWQAVPSAALTLPAPRPPNCLLDNRRLALYGLAPLPTWEEALDEYLTTDSTP